MAGPVCGVDGITLDTTLDWTLTTTWGNSEINSVQHAYTAPLHNYQEFIIDGATISPDTVTGLSMCYCFCLPSEQNK